MSPALDICGRTWDEVLGAKKRKFRGNLRRSEARLREQHDFAFRLADDAGRLDEDFEALVSLRRRRWGDDDPTGVFEDERGRFHRAFAGRALERGWLRLWIGEMGGRPVAAWYGWRFAGADWFFSTGRDPDLPELSLGSVMLVNAIRSACDDGMRSFEFLAGDEPYKRHFSDADRSPETVVIGARPAGRLVSRALTVAARMPGPVGRRLAA